MTLSIIRDAESHELVRDPHFQSQWTQLYEDCPWATACQSPGFVTAWHEAYKDRYSPLVIAEFSPSRDLIGLLSLATENSSGRMVVAGAHQAEYKAWLALPSNGSSFMEAALAQLACETDISTLSLRYIPPGTPIDWITRSQGPWTCELKPHPRPIIPIGGGSDVAPYLQEKKSGKSMRNCWNRLKRLGSLRLDQIREAGQLALVFDQLIAYYDIRQGGIHGKLPFQSDLAKKPFHLALLRVPNLLHVTLLKAGQEIISACFGVTYRNVYSGVMPIISPFHAADSPMQVHLLMLLEQLHQDGYSVFDLTASMDPFKERFAATYDSVHVLSIYFRRRDWIKQKVTQRCEALARGVLRSLQIAPNRALEHGQQLIRVPLRTAPSALARKLIALSQTCWSATELRVYRCESKNARLLEDAPMWSRDHLADLLAFQSMEVWRTRAQFLAECLKRIEKGHHFYTRVENGRLLHISWLIGNQEMNVVPETNQVFPFPPGSAFVYGSYTDPGSRGHGLFRSALWQMLHYAARAPGIRYVFIAVLADNKPACQVIKKVGFSAVSVFVGRATIYGKYLRTSYRTNYDAKRSRDLEG
jgi:CelD/BcsL family acetyltransferase involved in cellulose biosynthesis/RimJ/RimL family protein N-acetyltransferase